MVYIILCEFFPTALTKRDQSTILLAQAHRLALSVLAAVLCDVVDVRHSMRHCLDGAWFVCPIRVVV